MNITLKLNITLQTNGFINKDHYDDATQENRSHYNGKRYITLVSGGIKEEGDPYPGFYTSEEFALEAYEETLKKFLKQEAVGKTNPQIIWRIRPKITTGEIGSGKKPGKKQIYPTMFYEKKYTYYNIYSRLIVV